MSKDKEYKVDRKTKTNDNYNNYNNNNKSHHKSMRGNWDKKDMIRKNVVVTAQLYNAI